MAKDKKVEQITDMEIDFAQWFTDVCTKAELVDYSGVKGLFILRPYGYAIWENIQKVLDGMFKRDGHENVSMPMLIPESLLQKEKDHVEGFAPECAWVTVGGSEELPERLCILPTSETLFCDHWSHVVHSWRDLPIKCNQWCNVMRWEMRTRPFLRTSEFLWQEGHTAHATAEEAQEETERMLEVYREFMENVLAIPVICGRKSEKEKFAGAEATYTLEAMMQDGKALQMGTSHNLGDHFAKAYDITYLSREGRHEYCFTTSWGVSTRMIGGLIMTHGDDRGLMFPPRIAPVQLIILPIAQHKPGVLDKAYELKKMLSDAGIRVELDDSDQSAGWKFNQWEMKGVPVRLEIGPKDIENNQVVLVRRDTHEKLFVSIDGLADTLKQLFDTVQNDMYNRAKENRVMHTVVAKNMDELNAGVQNGFVKAMWCGDRACEDKIKEMTGATTRCMPFDADDIGSDTCVCCGKKAKAMTYFAKSY